MLGLKCASDDFLKERVTSGRVCIFPHVDLPGTSCLQPLEVGVRLDHEGDSVMFIYKWRRQQQP